MRRSFSFLILSLFLVANAAAEKKTTAQYWEEAGMSLKHPLVKEAINTENCYTSEDVFRGCVAALNVLAANAKSGSLRLVPTVLLKDNRMGLGEAVESFPGLSLVKPSEKSENIESRLAAWKLEEERRAKLKRSLGDLFKGARLVRVNFSSLFDLLVTRSSIPANDEGLIAATMVNALMIEAVDAHAHLEPWALLSDRMSDASESFVGIGANLGKTGDKVYIESPMEGGPASSVGIKSGDTFLAIDGKSVVGATVEEVVKLLRGPEGTRVNVVIGRSGKELPFTLTRARVRLKNVTSSLLQDIGGPVGYIRLRQFAEEKDCANIEAAIKEFEANRATSLILDLRANGGGLLRSAVCIGSLFVGKKVIVRTKNLISGEVEENVGEQDAVTNLPMVVLIDGFSASASELLSGALQDYQRAWIVGERSFGKGSVQAPVPVNREGTIVLMRTTARFHQPSDRTNQIVGIQPDFVVPFKPDATEEERFTLREEQLFPNALRAIGKPWSQPRVSEVNEVKSCLNRGGEAVRLFQARTAKGGTADYQLLTGQEILKCVAR